LKQIKKTASTPVAEHMSVTVGIKV